MLPLNFFQKGACELSKALLGKVLMRWDQRSELWLQARIIETEAYYLTEKGSHASLGYTEKRKALFMPAGTIYMYYARGGDSLNISAEGEGNAVLIKSGIPYSEAENYQEMLCCMQKNNPQKNCDEPRAPEKLCSGQTLLCKSLNLKVPEWDQQQFNKECFYIKDVSYVPEKIIQSTRLGIPKGRDEHLPYRFIDAKFATSCTKKPARTSY